MNACAISSGIEISSPSCAIPTFGIIFSSSLVTLLLILNYQKNLVDTFTFIISLATLAAIIAYLYTTIAEFVIYLKHPDKIDKKKITKSLTIAALGFLYTFWVAISSGQEIVYLGALLMFTSIPIFGWMQWQKYRKQFLMKIEKKDRLNEKNL